MLILLSVPDAIYQPQGPKASDLKCEFRDIQKRIQGLGYACEILPKCVDIIRVQHDSNEGLETAVIPLSERDLDRLERIFEERIRSKRRKKKEA
jgi:hypothetical protein